MLVKQILYCGEQRTFICDEKCNKAWGISNRMKIMLSNDGDDCAYLGDNELGEAPICTGTWEGGEGKPTNDDEKPNKWCCRECERSTILNGTLNDFSKRVYNKFWRREEGKKEECTK